MGGTFLVRLVISFFEKACFCIFMLLSLIYKKGQNTSRKQCILNCICTYLVFSSDVTTAMLVSLNKGTVAMLVPSIYSPRIKLYSFGNVFVLLESESTLSNMESMHHCLFFIS